MTYRFVTLIAALSVVAQLAHAQESYALHYAYKQGKIYRYSNMMATTSTREMMGREVKTTANVFGTTRLAVDNVADDGSCSFTTSMDSLRIDVKSPEMDTTIVPEGMTGKRSSLVVTKYGVIRSRAVIDTIKGQAMMMGVGQREMVRFHQLSEKPVKTGEGWKVSTKDSIDLMGGTSIVATEMAYTLGGKEVKAGRECLKVSYTGTSTTVGKGSMMGMEIFIEGTTKMSGTFDIDPEQGLIIAEVMEATGESTVATTGQQAMTIPVSTTIKSTRALIQD